MLQQVLGMERFLKVFARFKISTLKGDKKEGDFFAFLSLLPKQGTVLDIGANIGIMTYFLQRHMTAGRVVAFEPLPMNRTALNYVVDHYQLTNVTVKAAAVGAESGDIEMVLPVVQKAKKQGLAHVIHDSITDFNEGETLSVHQVRLDELSSELGEVVGVKMDIENYEYFALQGMRELMAKHKPVLYLELWDNENRQRCFDLLSGLGYCTYIVEFGKLSPYNPSKHNNQNFVFRFKE